MERRRFIIAALTIGAAPAPWRRGGDPLDNRFLGTTGLSTTDLEHLRESTARLNEWDLPESNVGAHDARRLSRSADVALFQLQQFTPDARNDGRLEAIAHASASAAYVLFDSGDTDEAKKALSNSVMAATLITSDVGPSLVHRCYATRTRLAVHELQTITRYPKSHLRSLLRSDPPPSLSGKERALAHRVAARVHSNLGSFDDTWLAIDQADRWWACDDTPPPWVGPARIAEHYGDTGQSLADLYIRHGEARAYEPGLQRLTLAATHEHAHLRTRLFSSLTAATMALKRGEREHGVRMALDAMHLRETVVGSAQADHMVKQLQRVAHDAEQADLVEQIDA